MKRILEVLCSTIILFLSPAIAAAQEKPDITLYWREGCPHCELVKEVITNNSIENYLNIKYVETSASEENANAFLSDISKCNIGSDIAGVPMIVSDGKCYMGEDECYDIIESLSDQELVKSTSTPTSTPTSTTDTPKTNANNSKILLIGIGGFLILFVAIGYISENINKNKNEKK